MTVPVARLSSFYLFYYAALGAFTPYWSLFLTARGMSVTAISVMMGLWYATRVVAPSTGPRWQRPRHGRSACCVSAAC